MRPAQLAVAATILVLLLGCVGSAPQVVLERVERYTAVRDLPPPRLRGSLSVEQGLEQRRSVRTYSPAGLSVEDLGQLLWAAQGVTDPAGHRTAPSAGALYPLEIYAVTAREVMHYLPKGHRIEVGSTGGLVDQLGSAAFDQEWINEAPLVLVITGVVSRTERKYGAIARRLMDREAGHAAQNVLLEATALGLSSVPVGGFEPVAIGRILSLPPGEEVLYLLPVGYPV